MTEKAVIDRFEGDKAVLLVGDKPTQLVVEKSVLPKRVKEGTWLKVEIEGGLLVKAEVDAEGMAEAKKRIAEKQAALRRGDQLK
jgi:hypothetical protein